MPGLMVGRLEFNGSIQRGWLLIFQEQEQTTEKGYSQYVGVKGQTNKLFV